MRLTSELARGRLSPRAVAIVLAALVLGAAAVALALSGDHGPAPTKSKATRTAHGHRPPAVSARQLARARQAARAFLAGYLQFAYGRASPASVRAVTSGLRRQLVRSRAPITPVEQSRRPRVLGVTALVRRPDVVAVALVDDGGIANYAVTLTLRKHGAGWLVSGVDEG